MESLYRKYRPQTFADVVGQQHVVGTLQRAVMEGRTSHAYLFCGPRGTGKTTMARLLAKSLMCEEGPGHLPDGTCEQCTLIAAGEHPDVYELDAASRTGVDNVREEIITRVGYAPVRGRYKVYIIDEVHMLTTAAFNALLKTLEEPPDHVVFVLCTTDPQKIPATILSRCQRFDFHRICVDTIIERLMVVLGGIGRAATDDALYEIARAAEGAMRDALSLLDVCLSYTDGEVTAQLARDVLGTAGRSAMFEFADALIDGDAGAALTQIDQVMRRGSDPQVFIRDTVAHLRGVMLAGAVREGLSDILEITPEDAARFRAQAERTDAEGLNRMLELFVRAEPDTKWASRPRTILELAAVRACHPEKEPDAAISERVSRVERLIEQGVPAAPAKPAPKRETPAPAPEKPAVKPAPTPAAEPPEAYLEAVRQLSEDNPSIRSPLGSMRFTGFDGQRVTVEFAKNRMMHMKVLERKKALIDEALTAAFGATVSVAMALEGSGAPEKKTSDVARDVINQSYDVFGRENIDLVE